MTTYIVKTILCAASLFLVYYLLLEREKMYRFNRFFLLFCIAFSFMVSFIVIKVAAPVVPVSETVVLSDNSLPAGAIQQAVYAPVETNNFLPNFLWALYIGISAFLLYRFIRNLVILFSKVKNNPTVAYSGAILVLTEDHAVPHSFLNYIFIDREKYEKGLIEKEILQHELTHVNQKHSMDILLVELLMVFGWVNPLLFFFRRSILLNHEFLADEAVVNAFNDTELYQLMLFDNACRSNNLILSSSFNYLLTKKRLIMMTRTTSQRVAIVKQIALIPLIATIGFLFSTRVIAQDNTQLQKQKQIQERKIDSSRSDVSRYKAKLEKDNLDKKEAEKKSLLEHKIKLEKEQQSQLSKEQKDKFEKEKDAKLGSVQKEKDAKLGSVQKEKLKMELDAKQTREQKIKSEKDSKQLYEQKIKSEKDSKQLLEQKLKLEKDLQKQQSETKPRVEVVFTNKLTAKDLENIKNDLKTKGIALECKKIEFDKEGHLYTISFAVDCNDGFKGSASSYPLKDNYKVGFYRDYSKKAATPFGTGSYPF